MTELSPTMGVLERLYHNSKANGDEVFTRLYRYMLRPDLYYAAYKNLYANNGAATKGVDNDTADGFSNEKINEIIKCLTDQSYQPKPSRRTYIDKDNGKKKKRSLGIPTFTDKLIQEVLRMILQAVYEPVFLDCSHGFRPQRSCHTALTSIKKEFSGAKWFVEGDIKGCFDNIDHSTLVSIIGLKIKDARLIKLIHKFLKAGYMEDWRYFNTYSGTPQGGIISPLLANIYLNELDKFVMKLKADFDCKGSQRYTSEYYAAKRATEMARKAIRECDEQDTERKAALIKRLKAVRAVQLKTPCKSQTDKKIKYIRYADDFIIAVNGDHDDCVEIKCKLTEFLGQILKMELSEEKTLITHSNENARFLGYYIRVRRNDEAKSHGAWTQRTLNHSVELKIPFEKVKAFMFKERIVRQVNGELIPCSRPHLLRLTELEIITTYNAELRGICNYYNLASDFTRLAHFGYLMEYSCLHTLANKAKSSIRKILSSHRDGKGKWGVKYKTKLCDKIRYFAKYTDCRDWKDGSDIKPKQGLIARHTRNSFDKRLNAQVCELCGSTESKRYEIHHVHKIKDLKGKVEWERSMISRRRKTLVVCYECHKQIHGKKSCTE